MPYPTETWGSYKAPRWNDETLEHMDYDESAEAEAIDEMVDTVIKELTSKRIIKKAKRMMSLGYSKQSLERFFSEDARASYSNYGTITGYLHALSYYLIPKSMETHEPTYVCALEFNKLSPEEQRAEVEPYVAKKYGKEIKDTYQRYEKDFNNEKRYRDEKDAALAEFVEKYDGRVDSMSYEEICKALDEPAIKELAHSIFSNRKYLALSGADKIIDQMEAAKRAKEEDPSVLKFFLGTMNGWGKEEEDRYEELKELIKQNHVLNVRTSQGGRCWIYTKGCVVDDAGELVALYSYDVDSSD